MSKTSLKAKNNNFDVFKFNKYMAMYPFNEKVAFNQWLDTNNLTYDQFLEWFDRENTSNNSMEDCPWMDYLMCSYEATDNVADKYTNKFGVLIDFMLEKAISDLKNKLINKNVNINFQLLLNIFIKELSESLINMIAPTLTLELNVARISKKLSGNNTEERYESYIQKLSDKEYIYSLFTEYPVLLKRLKNKIEYSASEIHEVYSHLVNDYHALCDTFGNLGQFKGFLNKRGDSHNQGRFVRICQFESKSIVYKPRSLRIDVAFQDLLIDLNKCTGVDFKTYTNIDKITYGWSEFIESKSCKNKEELCQYYINLGNYLMLMYVLNSSDFHFENIISVSKHPIPIDLETILHANASYDGACDTNIDQHTVLDSLILPQKIKFSHNDEYVDYSVLGFNNELLVNDKIGVANDLKRDDIKYKAIIKKVNKSKSNKTVNAKYELNDQDISNYLCQGFESLYHFFQNNKNWLVDNENFQKLSHQSYRFICRSTNTYISLIRSSYHPDYLRNENDLKLYLQQRLWQERANYSITNEIIKYEVDDIINNDVPLFQVKSNNNAIFHNKQALKNNNISNLLETVEAINENLSVNDLTRQLWIIKASIKTKKSKLINNGFKHDFYKSNNTIIKDYIESSTQILLSISPNSENQFSWKNYKYLGGDQCTHADLERYELFNGELGCILYLYYYSKIFNDTKVFDRAETTLYSIIKDIDLHKVLDIGGYVGLGGVLYFLAKIYDFSNNKDIIPLANTIANEIKLQLSNDGHFDILNGSAGAILSLLSAYKVFKDNRFLTVSILCGEHLLKNSQKSEVGCAWKNLNNDEIALGGFSHGVSGIGFALAKLASVSGKSKFEKYANKAIDYENSLFNKINCNYCDLRLNSDVENSQSDITAWCNGIVGIAISRIDMLINGNLPEKKHQFLKEIPRNIRKIIDKGLGNNHSLCHGDASSLEYLFMVSQNYPEFFSPQDFNNILNKTLININQTKQKNGVNFDLFSPGLMLGSLGLPYQCMRFKDHKIVGSISLLN